MDIEFKKLTEPTDELVERMNKWENDPEILPLIRPNKNQDDGEKRGPVTIAYLEQRLQTHRIYLIYLQDQLVGVMDYQVDPKHLYKKETGTAWISIVIGEAIGRDKGIGYLALQYLEKEIKEQDLKRIELGVFEFNTKAIKLYQKLGYKEIARIEKFTYWQGKMWHDIRMEKSV